MKLCPASNGAKGCDTADRVSSACLPDRAQMKRLPGYFVSPCQMMFMDLKVRPAQIIVVDDTF